MATAIGRIGEYRIIGEIVRTPSYVAYDGIHVMLPRRVLLKVLTAPTHRLAVRSLREPFFLETLQHPGIARVFESSLLPDRRPWFAREHVEGPTLAELRATRELGLVGQVSLLRDVADVLAHAHRRGVLHCGLRPDRITFTQGTRGFPICLADWSEARTHDARPAMYVPSSGSWQYAAPELVRGEPVDERADVFALGAVAYQLFAGALPYDRGFSFREVGGYHVPAHDRCPEIPRDLTMMVDRMLAFDRNARPYGADVRDHFAAFVESYVASPRSRKPRWTPEVPFAAEADPDDVFEQTLSHDFGIER